MEKIFSKSQAGSNLIAFQRIVREQLPQLTRNQKRIAQYFLDHPEEIAFATIDDLAKKLGVGTATIVRLSKLLGYKGFLQLKADISSNLLNDLSLSQKFKAVLSTAHNDLNYINTLAKNEIENIRYTLQQLDLNAFDQAVTMLASAGHIYTMGLGLSSYLAHMAAYFLNRISLKAKPFSHGIISFQEQIISLSTDDVLLTFSLPPYSVQTIEAAECATMRQIPVITITDKLTAPIVQFADVVIPVRTKNIVFINTISSVMLVIYILTTGLGIKNRDQALQSLELFEQVKTNFGFDVQTEFFKSI